MDVERTTKLPALRFFFLILLLMVVLGANEVYKATAFKATASPPERALCSVGPTILNATTCNRDDFAYCATATDIVCMGYISTGPMYNISSGAGLKETPFCVSQTDDCAAYAAGGENLVSVLVEKSYLCVDKKTKMCRPTLAGKPGSYSSLAACEAACVVASTPETSAVKERTWCIPAQSSLADRFLSESCLTVIPLSSGGLTSGNLFVGCEYDTDYICSIHTQTDRKDFCSPSPVCASSGPQPLFVLQTAREDMIYLCFDKKTKTCKSSSIDGAMGNYGSRTPSRYPTRAACEAACVETTPATAIKKEIKPAISKATKYACDTELQICHLDKNGAFASKASCEDQCEGAKITPKKPEEKPRQQLPEVKIFRCDKKTGEVSEVNLRDVAQEFEEGTCRGTQEECKVLCEVSKATKQKKYSCDRAQKICRENPTGGYDDVESCEAECFEPPPLFKTDVDCKKHAKKLAIQTKSRRLFYESLLKENDKLSENLAVLLKGFSRDAKELEKGLADAQKVVEGCKEKLPTEVARDDNLHELELNLETLVEEHESRESAQEISQERRERLHGAGFRDEHIENPHLGAIFQSFFDQAFSTLSIENEKACFENFVHFGSRHQRELSGNLARLFVKLRDLEKALEKRDVQGQEKSAFVSSLQGFLQEPWSPSFEQTIAAKFKQVILELENPREKIAEIRKDLASFLEERQKENREVLYDEERQPFADIDACQWYFSIFLNPKQRAFKGTSGKVNPAADVREIEFLLALSRTLQMKNVEEGQCVNPDLPNGINPPEWGKCSLHSSCELLDGLNSCAKTLRLEEGTLTQPLSREKTALFIWKLMKTESVTKDLLARGIFKIPTQNDVNNVCDEFKDCGVFAKDEDLLEAVAAMNMNNFMTGKKPGSFGFRQTLLRAEAAKILLFLAEAIQ